MKLHEFANTIENVVVLGGRRGHLLNNRGHVTENCGIEKSCNGNKLNMCTCPDSLCYVCGYTCNYHHANGEDFLVVGFCSNVTKSHAGHASHGVVEGRDVHGLSAGPVSQLDFRDGPIVSLEQDQLGVRLFADTGQAVQPPVLDTVDQVRVANGVPEVQQKVYYVQLRQKVTKTFLLLHCSRIL